MSGKRILAAEPQNGRLGAVPAPMKSCFGLLIALVILVAVLGTGAAIWYLSDTAEFSRKPSPAVGGTP